MFFKGLGIWCWNRT